MSCVSRPAGVHSEIPALKQASDLDKQRLGCRTFWEWPAGGKQKIKQSEIHAFPGSRLGVNKSKRFILNPFKNCLLLCSDKNVEVKDVLTFFLV